jgi:hypothetical protein
LALISQALLPGESIFLLGGTTTMVFAIAALAAAPLLLPLYGMGFRRWLRASPPVAAWAWWLVLYVAAYALAGLRGVRMFHWYLVPLTPFYTLLLAQGVRALAERSEQRRWLSGAAASLLVLWWLPGLVSAQGIGYPTNFALDRERLYRTVALDYAARWEPSTVVAAPEIGALGYYSQAQILDTVGLISPVAARYYPLPAEQLASDNAVAPRLIADARPDYVVSLDQFVRKSLLLDPTFQASYTLVEARPAVIWDSTQLLVYRRGDAS